MKPKTVKLDAFIENPDNPQGRGRGDPEYKTRQFFRARGIHPTLAEYREIYACMRNGSNPFGIH